MLFLHLLLAKNLKFDNHFSDYMTTYNIKKLRQVLTINTKKLPYMLIPRKKLVANNNQRK